MAARWADGMPGGPENPLGARALYLYQGEVDTLYRIHGTNQPESIGKAVSSGCIRLINADIAELYSRVQLGSKVIVLPLLPPHPSTLLSGSRQPKPAKRGTSTFESYPDANPPSLY